MLLLALALACPTTVIENTSKLKWTSYDTKMLNYAKKRCGELYKDSPCVKLFRKFEFQSYSVVCGEKI